MGCHALHILCCYLDASKDSSKALKDAYSGEATARGVMGMTPLEMYLKCRRLPHDNNLYREYGDALSLVQLLKCGLESDVLKTLVDACVDEREPGIGAGYEGMQPFMVAASLPKCGLCWQ